MDADYAEAEQTLHVKQLDPETMGRNGQLAMEGAAAIGASGAPIHRNAGDCNQCSSCPFGCEIDAKRGMHVSYLPRAVAAGARIRAGVEVDRVLVEDGRAVGVSGSTRAGAGARRRPFTVRARRAVIAAGGAFGTPELLQRSGLGGKQVGRNLHIHPACWVGARYEEEVRGWDGVMQSYYVDQWEPTGILLEATFTPLAFGGAWLLGAGESHQRAMLDFGHVGSIGVHLCDESSGRVGLGAEGSLRASYKLTQGRRRPARLRHRPRRRSPLRRRRHRGLPQHRPRRRAASRATWPSSRRPPSSPPSCAWRPSTRWAPPASPPTNARAPAPSTAPSTAPRTSTSPTAPSSPPRSASTR